VSNYSFGWSLELSKHTKQETLDCDYNILKQGDVMVSTGIQKIEIAIRSGNYVKTAILKKETTIIITHLRLN